MCALVLFSPSCGPQWCQVFSRRARLQMALQSEPLVASCKEAAKRVEAVVAMDGDENEAPTKANEKLLEKLSEFFAKSEESFRGRVHPELMLSELQAVQVMEMSEASGGLDSILTRMGVEESGGTRG